MSVENGFTLFMSNVCNNPHEGLHICYAVLIENDLKVRFYSKAFIKYFGWFGFDFLKPRLVNNLINGLKIILNLY